MADLIINIFGANSYRLDLSLHDAAEDDSVEVWCATFTDTENNDSESVYFEINTIEDIEIWDLINLAIDTYRKEILDDSWTD
jgi:hypothetical protein